MTVLVTNQVSAFPVGFEIPAELSLAEKLDLCVWAEQHGFSAGWLTEVSEHDSFVALGLAARSTSTLRLGTGIVPLGVRSIPSLAVSAATLAEVSDGRYSLGVGVSSKAIVEGWHGVSWAAPLQRARESLTMLRLLLNGQRTDSPDGVVTSRGFRLRRPPSSSPPIVLAAMNERMLELAGEVADGVLLNYVPVAAVPHVKAAVERGAERSGRSTLPELILSVPCEVTDEPEEARHRFRHDLAFYLTAPPYRRSLAWHGFSGDTQRAEAAWEKRDLDLLRAGISNELIDAIGMFGSAPDCWARLAEWRDAGITSLSITALGSDPRAVLQHFALQ